MGNAISDAFAPERSLGDGGSFDWSCYDNQRSIRAVPTPRHNERAHTQPPPPRRRRGASSPKGGGPTRSSGSNRNSPRNNRNKNTTTDDSTFNCSTHLSDFTSRCQTTTVGSQESDQRAGNNNNNNNNNKKASSTTRSIATRSTSCFTGYDAGDNASAEGGGAATTRHRVGGSRSVPDTTRMQANNTKEEEQNSLEGSQGGGDGKYGQHHGQHSDTVVEGGYLSDGDDEAVSATSDMAHHGQPRVRLSVESLQSKDGAMMYKDDNKGKDNSNKGKIYDTEEEPVVEEREEHEDEEAYEEERVEAEEYEEGEDDELEEEEERENEVHEVSSVDDIVGEPTETYPDETTEEYIDVGDSGTLVDQDDDDDDDEDEDEQVFVTDGRVGDITEYAEESDEVVSGTDTEVTVCDAEELEEEQITGAGKFTNDDEDGDGFEDDAAVIHEIEEDRVTVASSSRARGPPKPEVLSHGGEENVGGGNANAVVVVKGEDVFPSYEDEDVEEVHAQHSVTQQSLASSLRSLRSGQSRAVAENIYDQPHNTQQSIASSRRSRRSGPQKAQKEVEAEISNQPHTMQGSFSPSRKLHSMEKDVEEIVEQLHTMQGSLSLATTKEDVEEIAEQLENMQRSITSSRRNSPSKSTKNEQLLEKEEKEADIIELVDIDEKVYDQCVESGEEVSSKISSNQNSEKSETRGSWAGEAKSTAILSTEEIQKELYPELKAEYINLITKIRSIELDDLYPSFPKFGNSHSSIAGSIRSRLPPPLLSQESKKSIQSSQKDTAQPDHDDNATMNTRGTLVVVSSVEGSFGTREPGGVKDCDVSVEESYAQIPEEKMAQNILNARIKQALRHGEMGSESAAGDEASAVSKRRREPGCNTSVPSPVNEDEFTEVLSHIDGVDIEFIQQYETAFEAFLQQNLDLMAQNPELVYNLRVAKLQQVLQLLIENEAKLTETIGTKKKEKDDMVAICKKQLVEAARKKAALEIHLRQELATIQQATVETKGKLTWQVIMKNNQRAKQHYHMLKRLSREKAGPGQLLQLLPDQPGMEAIRNAASLVDYYSAYDRDLQQFQVDNALLKAEVKVLEKKLAYEQAIAKKYAWVDSLLIRMESDHYKNLKRKYQKKLGVQF